MFTRLSDSSSMAPAVQSKLRFPESLCLPLFGKFIMFNHKFRFKYQLTPFLLFFVFSVLTIQVSWAQSETDLSISKSRQVNSTQNSDGAAFEGGNATGFTGNSNISVPLYEIKLKGLSIPIAIKYNNSGIKVDQSASEVGLGWLLEAGGVITRQLHGQADDVWKDNPRFNREYGFLLDQGAGVLNFTNENVSSENIGKQLATLNGKLIKRSADIWTEPAGAIGEVGRKSDLEPDLFSFNFGGKTGKFIFGNDQKINFLNYEPYKTDYLLDNSPNPNWINQVSGYGYMSNGIISFSFIDEKGNKFVFSDLGTSLYQTQGSRIMTQCDLSPDAPNFESYLPLTTSWYLTKIETFSGEIVNYSYADEKIYTWEIQRSKRNTGSELDYENTGLYKTGQTRVTNWTVTKKLISIETPYETINFGYDLNREDINSTRALTSISVKNKPGNSVIKSAWFNYSYFLSDTSEPTMNSSINNPLIGNRNPYKRLKLNSVSIGANGDYETFPKYTFAYNEVLPLPNFYSYEQDFWGYYNDNGATTLFPTIYVRNDLLGADRFSVLNLNNIGTVAPYVIQGADRNVKETKISTGTLTKIIYPTGGSTTYDYEPNDFMYKGKKYLGGGLRVWRITDYDGISHSNDMVKSYNHSISGDPSQSSGAIFDIPIFAYLENNCATDLQGTGFEGQNPPAFPRDSYEYFFYNLTRVDHPMHINGFGDGTVVGYSEVREDIANNGYNLYKYSAPVKYSETYDSVDGLFSVPVINYILAWRPNGVLVPDQGPDLLGVDLSLNSYPFIQNPNYDWARGLISEKSVFNIEGILQKRVRYNYDIVNPENVDNLVYGLYYQNGNNYNIKNTQQANTHETFTQALVYFGKYKIYINRNKILTSQETTDFFSNGTLSSTSTFTYSHGKFLSSSTVAKSGGEITKNKYLYPFDLVASPSASVNPVNSISFLVQKNNIIEPVEKVSLVVKNGQEYVVGAKVLQYSNTGYNTVAPLAEKLLRTSDPIPISQYVPLSISFEESYENLNLDPRFENEIVYNKYDERSNVLETVGKNKRYSSFIYGYNKMYPVATFANARFQNVFHDNFEEASGNAFLGHTGLKYFNGNYIKYLGGLDNGAYILSYWLKTGANWVLHRDNVNVVNSTFTINLTGQLDDVSFLPVGSTIATNTYIPLIGLVGAIDEKGQVTSFEYDPYNRMSTLRDQDGNILKSYQYNTRTQ